MKVAIISNYNNNPRSYPNYLTAVFIDQTEKKKQNWRGGKGGGGGGKLLTKLDGVHSEV